MWKLLFLLVPFFLTSCFSIESTNQVRQDGAISYDVVMDMSGMMDMMSSLSGSTSSDSTSSKDLCKDFDTKMGSYMGFYQDISCQSLADYRARIASTLPIINNPGIFVGSGVVVFNPIWSNNIKKTPVTKSSDMYDGMDAESAGMKIVGTFHFPYPVVYADAGKRTDASTVFLNMLDKKIAVKREIFIIARADGKKPTIKELNNYKRIIRNQLAKAKRSGKYEKFEDIIAGP